MQILYAFQGTESDDLKPYENQLAKSMEGMLDLYILMLNLLLAIQLKAEKYEVLKAKQLSESAAILMQNSKFVENSVIEKIKTSDKLQKFTENRKLNNWEFDDEYPDLLFKSLVKNKIYRDYMADPERDFKTDRLFILDIYKNLIAPSEKLYEYFEDKKITWLDDYPVVNTVLVKMLKKLNEKSSGDQLLPDLFRDDEDRDFGIDLLKKTILNLTKLNTIIQENTTNWDKDRIAKLDLVLLQMAICEIRNFSSIPVKVTINEYLEIAKEYSTPKSSVFINGILDKILKDYEAKGTLNKMGRGLM
ncbi:MAG: transcription antitermination factor NusB [Flavobacteriaceae bacterium]|nr:transcription antitermination factor NusB [Bacteroidia bacterium]NNK88167.1 transcription antitermination factor NusB [Flavobacteriaceae bacterium]